MAEFDEVLFDTASRLIKFVNNLPKSDNKKTERIKKLIDDGASKIQKKLYDEAIKCFEEAIRIEPTSFGAHLALVRGFKEKGKDLEALSWGGFALSLADNAVKRKMVYLLLGSTALDTFKLSHALVHATQSLAFYQLALNEDPTELRAVWNSVETHVQVVLTGELAETVRSSHRSRIAKNLEYLDDAFAKAPNPALASRFVCEGERIQKMIKGRSLVLSEFSRGLSNLGKHAEVVEKLGDIEGNCDNIDKQQSASLRVKVLAYVIASFLLSSGAIYAALGAAEGAELPPSASISAPAATSTQSTVPNLEQVIEFSDGNGLTVVSVDPDWEEFKELATVDPNWDEMKRLA